MKFEQIIVVRAKTYLEELIERFNSRKQAQFYLESSGRSFNDILNQHDSFYKSMDALRPALGLAERYKIIDRSFLPNYIFGEKDLIIGMGQDGLIANIAKYSKGQPIIGYNPNPDIYDGILLPYQTIPIKKMREILENEFESRKVTMAKSVLSDGQQLLAFNDFFIGPKSHISARYKLHFNQHSENQSSSGIIISTGIGSTGWLSSISNMICSFTGKPHKIELKPHLEKLAFVVREPFKSITSEIEMTFGIITQKDILRIESKMVDKGVIFSDGIEKDYIPFNVGTSVEIGIAEEKAILVQ